MPRVCFAWVRARLCVSLCVCVCVCVLSHSQESLVSYFYVFYDLDTVLVAGRTLAP